MSTMARVSPVPQPRLLMAEHEVKAALRRLGVQVPPSVLLAPADPVPSSFPFPFPVAVKVSSRALLHKTEARAVFVGVKDASELQAVASDLRERFAGELLLVEPVERPGVEAIVGFFRDPVFGPCAMVGVGGVYAELYQDVAFRRLPVDEAEVSAMLDELRARALFEGFRGRRVSREALVRLVVAVSRWVEEMGREFGQMDLNPVFVREHDAVVIDAKLMGPDG
ncbi:MAG: acetate--CoA ligase family protein [Limnochordaceae bacterium]|nr:acetate--CoA ligase family protein [Limnochordaceae bacterium]